MTAAGMALAGALVSLVGVATGHAVIVVTGMLLATIGGLAWVWSTYLLSGVTVSLTLERDRVRPGGETAVDLVVENDQPFPVPWLDCRVDWPAGLEATRGSLHAHFLPGRFIMAQAFTLRWFERVTRRIPIACPQRGEYAIGPVDMTVADPFGLSEGRKVTGSRRRLVVYPRVVPVRAPGRYARSPFGHRPQPSWILDDPAHFRGSREYVPGDPFSRVEWKATARTGKLHTRLLDASYATEVALVVNVATRPRTWEGINKQLLERTLVVSASLTVHFIDAGYRVALYTNGFVRGQPGVAVARMGCGQTQLRACFEVLGRLMPVQAVEFGAALDLAARRAGDRARIVVVTGLLSPLLERATESIVSRGRAASVVMTGPAGDRWRGRVPLFVVVEKGGAADLEQVTLRPSGS